MNFGKILNRLLPQDSDIFECEVFLFGIRLNFLSSLAATAGLSILIKIGSIDCATLTGVNYA
jgi:hypothetical protein